MNFRIGVGALLAGFAIGWLAGLSRSAILSTLLPALLTAAIGAVPLARVLRKQDDSPPKDQVNLVALGLLAIGTALGATGSVLAIAHAWFAARPTQFEALADKIQDVEFKKKYLASMVAVVTAEKLPTPLQASTAPSQSQPCLRSRELLATQSSTDGSLRKGLIDAAEGDAALLKVIARNSDSELRKAISDYCAP